MTESSMNEMLQEWVKNTSVPVSFTGSVNDIREGAVSFAKFIMDKVDLVANEDEQPKEE